MSHERVRVVFRKYDGALHWHFDAVRLGEDEAGVWLGCPPNTPATRGDEPPRIWAAPGAVLFPRDGWWVATFNATPHKYEIYVDISTTPVWSSGDGADEVTMVDLDLDVVRMRDGEVRVLDEDEFAEHRVKYGYPPEVVAGARAATEWLAGVVGDDTEPFASEYNHWLTKVPGSLPGS